MKVYTGSGDRGKTSLFSGERMSKCDERVAAYGDVDELNAAVGSVASVLPEADGDREVRLQLHRVQSDLFQMGALLATTPASPSAEHLTPVTADDSKRLEQWIDAMESRLEPLNAFILPGGHPASALSHMARTICRRAERAVVKLTQTNDIAQNASEEILVYLNRLSDYFFVLARYCNQLAGVEDELWRG